ncbi:MAG: PDZ domain-containing protein [Fimbriimonadaceae bacterium]|nr:PDZ domain-containing protein [Fimbriimonadaceae bacterium]QYK55383.1 MAG: PDZ domain-containing protein [Fimbriimonadaceae bacterium]
MLAALFGTLLQLPVEIPFRIGENAIVVDAHVNGRAVSLMFDTGFSGTIVLNESLNVGPADGTINLRDFVGSFEAKSVKLKSLRIGPYESDVAERDIIQQPADHYTLAYGTHVDGILGLAPFARHVTEINFERKVIIVHPDNLDISTRQPDNKRTFMARMLPLGRSSIPMAVEAPSGKRMTLSLDTGNAFYATTHKEVLERVGLWEEGKKPRFMATSWVASGPVDSFYAELPDLKIYGVPVPKSTWSVIDLPSSDADGDGTIGFGFLKHFNVTFDLARRRVWLDNFSGEVTDPAEGEPGLSATFNPKAGRATVFNVVPGSPAEKAGIKRGDSLLGVDGADTTRFNFRQIEGRLRGEPGSHVEVSVSRNGELIRHKLERISLVN